MLNFVYKRKIPQKTLKFKTYISNRAATFILLYLKCIFSTRARQTFLTKIHSVWPRLPELSHDITINQIRYSVFLLIPLCCPDSKASHQLQDQKTTAEGLKAFWQIYNVIKHVISTAPSFLGKPYLPGYVFDHNTHFPTFPMTINYSKSGGGQQIRNPSESLYEQPWGWEAWGPWGVYFSGSGIHRTSYFDSDSFHLN